jgi:tRNA 2-selenouridine synthase
MTKITIKEALKTENCIFIDTRTPKEFAEDHLPKAINLPILSNDERALVGTLYKQVSQQKAIDTGVEMFTEKLPQFVKEIVKYKDKLIVVNCWRGGMRSKAVVALFSSLKYNVKQLQGGYKAYRNYVRETLYNYQLKPKLIVISGLTCTGKTAILNKIDSMVDLEGLAQHRGSMYGALGLQPHSQKRFESLLLRQLDKLQNEKYIFVEGESRRIGDLIIPEFFWKAMNKGVQVLVTRTMETRIKEGVKEYCDTPEKVAQIREISTKLFKVISKKRKQEMVDLIDQNKLGQAWEILLKYYYDPLYEHSLKELNFELETSSEDVDEAVKELTKFAEQRK